MRLRFSSKKAVPKIRGGFLVQNKSAFALHQFLIISKSWLFPSFWELKAFEKFKMF